MIYIILTQGEEPDGPAVYNDQQGVRHGCLLVPDAESNAPANLFVITIGAREVTGRACILAEPDGGREEGGGSSLVQRAPVNRYRQGMYVSDGIIARGKGARTVWRYVQTHSAS